jgi:hypothetical protein
MKTLSYVLNVIFLGFSGYFYFQYKSSQINLDFFQFDYRPPKFNERENQIIKITIPIILQKLEAPGNYYVNSVSEVDNHITVSVLPLRALQMGVNSKTGRGFGMWDGGIKFIFDSDYHFLEKINDA